jgi:medium-chain acyl-[acyl-carrier-protein] hydrolase
LASPNPHPWRTLSRGGAELALYCFPHAGGSAFSYRAWASLLPETIELRAIVLPGRESRLREPPHVRMAPLADEMARAIAAHADKPYALFGHSMGALVAYEVALRLTGTRVPPSRLLVSGARAPSDRGSRRPLHALSDGALIEALRTLDGTPPEVLRDAELMALCLPRIRADLAVCETYRMESAPRLDCPVSAFGGVDDAGVPRAPLEAWRDVTTAPAIVRMFPGGHFFLHAPALARSFVEYVARDILAPARPVERVLGPSSSRLTPSGRIVAAPALE